MSSISSMLTEDSASGDAGSVQHSQQHSSENSDAASTTAMDTDDNNKVQQRKRSKVSRACDECRRKKIRCDATFATHSNTLEKVCTSCSKNNLFCSFDRVPLKRGPTKGYTKNEGPIKNRSRNSSFEASQPLQITLPPLTSITGGFQNQQGPTQLQHQTSSQISQPTSPRKLSLDKLSHAKKIVNTNNPNPIIPQSQFWKVPHEPPFDRRDSVDSISSSISESRFSFPQANPQFAIRQSKYPESIIMSDSEDDLRSTSSARNSVDFRNNRSRSNSQTLQGGISTSPSMNQYSFQQQKFPFQPQQQQQPVINTNHLIDSYYRFIHPNLPILPLNNQSLINILSKPPPILQNEFDELNRFIIQNFYNSLDLLITIVSKNRLTTGNNSSLSLNVLNQNSQFLDSLNVLFIGLTKIFNKVINEFDKFQQQIMILFFSTLVILSYCVVLLGNTTDVLIINSSVLLFNRLRIFKLFWSDNLEQRTVTENFDDYHFQLRRLWMNLNTLFSLHCISHGLPRNTVFDLDLIQIDKNFPVFPGVEQMKDNLKLGWFFSKISSFRNFNNDIISKNSFINDYLKKELNFNSVKTLFNHNNEENSLSSQFFEFIINKFELIEFLQDIHNHYLKHVHNSNYDYDEELLFDYQFKLSRIIKKQLTIQSEIFSVIENNTNSIDNSNSTTMPSSSSPSIPSSASLIISPLLPLVFKQSIKNLNIMKILINSLQYNESLIPRLSKLLNELIKLTNILSLIKPFVDNELNNHLNFKINSIFLENWENLENNSDQYDKKELNLKIQETWFGLMFDVLKFAKMEDYEGWF